MQKGILIYKRAKIGLELLIRSPLKDIFKADDFKRMRGIIKFAVQDIMSIGST